MIVRLVSSFEVVRKVVDDLGLDQHNIPWESMLDWIAWGLNHIGSYAQYEHKHECVDIANFKGKLPQDFHRVNSTLFLERHKIHMDNIYVDFEEGELKLDYLAMPVDEEGYPLVPDDPTFFQALFYLIASKLILRGDYTNKELSFQYCDQKWLQLALAARAEAFAPDIQRIADRANDFTNLRYDRNPYRNKFKSIGHKRGLNGDSK
jgi:hypothetical protein